MAVHGLARAHPELSAALPLRRWQWAALITLVLLAAGAVAGQLPSLRLALPLLLAIPFAAVTFLRLAAHAALNASAPPAPPANLKPTRHPLPRYTVLVPLASEERVVPQLINALTKLDYPADRLQIVIITEAADAPTRAAVARERPPPHFQNVIVPEGEPRTKPRALNYALPEASGEYLVVYDAEDRPDPQQLRRALAAFRQGPANLGCLQARLNIYGCQASFWTRQFTMEYSVLFDAILPLLARLDLPVPLGGTSNHFPLAVLRDVGGWDSHNVTEDADLGIRLARRGWKVDILDSTTWEEAPRQWPGWLSQRTRWLKGWIQTYAPPKTIPGRMTNQWVRFRPWKSCNPNRNGRAPKRAPANIAQYVCRSHSDTAACGRWQDRLGEGLATVPSATGRRPPGCQSINLMHFPSRWASLLTAYVSNVQTLWQGLSRRLDGQ